MLNNIKNSAELILKKFAPYKQLKKQQEINKRYSTEIALIKQKHKNENKNPSIIHFSLNKSATQYIRSILTRCALDNGMTPVRIHQYAFNSNFPYLDKLSLEEIQKHTHIFKKHGYLYSAFGGMIEGIPQLEEYKTILVTRDPRDILVSNYYSIAFSHPTPDNQGNKYEKFVKQREKAKESTIDEYVIAESQRVHDIYHRYQTLLLDKVETAHITTYENMVSDFYSWLTDLIDYCGLKPGKELVQTIIQENNALKPKKEDTTKHLRKGTPGDYKQKLQPETIEYLNSKFATILERFHYNLS